MGSFSFVGNFSFAASGQYYNRYGTQIFCKDWSQDKFCIAAKATAEALAIEQAYCATSTICWTASEPLTLLMDFVREMTNSIKTMWTQGEYLGQYINPNRFQWNVFTPPVKTVVDKLARNISQKIKFGLASTAIFANPVNFAGGKDVMWWTVLLAKNKVFLRDNKLIEELESQVSDKKYELGLWWWWYEKINPENLQVMQAIIKKYRDAWLFDEWSQIKNGALYNNVTSLLTQMLSSAKTFLYFDSTSQFDDISRWGMDGVTIVFSTGAMWTIKRDYNCARGLINPCDSALKKFTNNMKTIWVNIKSSLSDSKKTFLSAIDRLGQLFSKNQSTDFKTREAELLLSIYGTRKITPWKFIDVNYNESNGNASTVKDIWAWIGDVASAIASGAVRSWKLVTNDIFLTREKIQKITSTEASYNSSQDAFTSMMNQYIGDVFANQAMDIELATFAEVKDITPAFTVLGNQIAGIKNNILGDKEKETSLLTSLWAAAKLQCSK